MEEEIGKLLKTQENLQEKYNEQLHSIDRYKRDNTNLKDEVEALKKVNQEIHLAATKDTASLERIRNSEEEMKNQSIVLRIEKETLGSEVDRLIGKLKNQDEKLRCRKEKEQDLIKDNSILRQEIRI
ncbi:uncharacterized protein [Clytia hemisphaerica]|uniref:uncharacterized protein n=1 Tax=Clytia hemisphaerica TaxID=252671 RepID=UPI0034D47475